MEFDFKTLELLRDYTYLDPISYFKVKELRDDALEYQQTINILENCQLGVDYSTANQLEARLRFEVWKRNIKSIWLNNSPETDFDLFALDYLMNNNLKPKKHILRRT